VRSIWYLSLTSIRHSAIMRGAVLSAMGLKIQSRIARCHYGFNISEPAKWDDPKDLQFWDPVEQVERCIKVEWCAKMVPSHAILHLCKKLLINFQGETYQYGHTFEHNVSGIFSKSHWDGSNNCESRVQLQFSEWPIAPKYPIVSAGFTFSFETDK
jgi:hypothetical protein